MRRSLPRFSLVILVALALFPVLLIGHVRFYSSRSRLPERGEEIRRLGGLEDEVLVIIDSLGNPHIEALAEADLWFVQGYLHARDRFFQMDLARKRAEGRLSELFGESELATDRFMRTLQLGAVARRQAAEIEGRDLRILERYTAGVNRALRKFGQWISEETWAIGLEPDLWRVEDSLAICLLHHLSTSRSMDAELRRSTEMAHYGRDTALELWGWEPRQARNWIPPVDMPSLGGGRMWSAGAGGSGNPSAWALAPDRTASGKAIVANVGLTGTGIPGGWFVCGLRAPGLHASGVSIAGVPGIMVGHNERVSWGFTGSGMDDQDLFVLTLDDSGSRELADGVWIALRTVTEEIFVRWQEQPEMLKVRLSRHGPILEEGRQGVLALAWTGTEGVNSIHAFLAMIRAESVAGAARAWEGHLGPPMHLIAADTAGRILHQVVGCEPVRGHGTGRLPSPGSDSSWAWDGFRPMERNPRVENPPEGFVAATDHDVFSEGDLPARGVFAGDFSPPWRIRTIRRRLAAVRDWDVERSLSLQGNLSSERAVAILKALWPDLERHGGPTARALLQWDGTMDPDSIEPHLGAELLAELSHEAGIDEARAVGLDASPIDQSRILHLLSGALGEEWWDDRRTEAVEGRRDIVDRCLDRMDIRDLQRTWGEVHRVASTHPLSGFPLLGRLFGAVGSRGPFPAGGDGTTVNGHPWTPDGGARTGTVATMRYVSEVGDWDSTVISLPIGQSGRIWSTHSSDQIGDWLAVRGRPLPFSRRAVEDASRARMVLVPRRSR